MSKSAGGQTGSVNTKSSIYDCFARTFFIFSIPKAKSKVTLSEKACFESNLYAQIYMHNSEK